MTYKQKIKIKYIYFFMYTFLFVALNREQTDANVDGVVDVNVTVNPGGNQTDNNLF